MSRGYSIVAGDLEPDMEIQVLVNDQAEDLSDCSATNLRWKTPAGTVSTVALVAGTGGLAAGRLKRTWVAGDTATAGRHLGQVVCVRGNGETQTFPSDGSYIEWYVNAVLT